MDMESQMACVLESFPTQGTLIRRVGFRRRVGSAHMRIMGRMRCERFATEFALKIIRVF